MYISLRVKVWVLLLVLIASIGAVFYESASNLIRGNSQEAFQTRIAGALRGAVAYWERERNQMIRSANLYSESEKVINFSAFGLHTLLHREIKRLLINSGFQELQVVIKSGVIVAGTGGEIERGNPLDLTDPHMNIADVRMRIKDQMIEVSAEVPLNKQGEFIGRLTLVKRWDDARIKEMGNVLQADFSLCVRGDIKVSSLPPDQRRDLLMNLYSHGESSKRNFELSLAGDVHLFSVADLGETVDKEPIRLYCALSQMKMLSMIEQARVQTLHLTLLALTISLFFAFLFSDKVLTGRIRQIRDGASLLAQERLSFRLPETWRDEVGDLTRSFNEMAAKVEESHQKLILQNEELQLYVRSLENMKTYIQNVLRSLGTGVITWNQEGRVGTMNPSAERELADVRETGRNLSLRGFLKLLHGPSRGIFLKALRALIKQNQEDAPFEIEFDMGEHRGFKAMQGGFTFLRDPQGEKYGMVLTLENITQRKIIERQLFHADKLSSIGQLAASVAHEIKNPLASIKTLGQLLQEETSAGDSRREYVDVIVSEVDRLNGVVEQLLKYARPEDSKFSRVKVGEMLKPVAALVHHEMDRHGVRLEAEFSEELELFVDAEKIKQVLVNLVFNAIQAMPEGGVLKIKVFRKPDSPWTLFSVEDSGMGMPTEVSNRVFEPFFTTKQRGTGLGLAIVKKIVDLHGGKIEVKSRPNLGTTFTIFLPNERTLRPLEAQTG